MKALKFFVLFLALCQLTCLYFAFIEHNWPFVLLNTFMLCTFHPYNVYMAWFKLDN